MTEWRETRLGNVLTLQRGFDITKAAQKPGSVPIVSSSGITSLHNEPRVEGPGVVIGRKGKLGTAFFLGSSFWPHDTTLWVKDFKGNDPYFCYLALKQLPLAALDVGSSNPTLNRNHAHSVRVAIPDTRTQRRIAAIGRTFDELIEINERRIELLEDLARSLYREWFVRFRFPGHEDVEFVDSELGPIPKGWRPESLAALATLVMGQSPKSEHYNENGSGLPFHQGVAGFGPLIPDHSKYCTVTSRVAIRGDVLCSVRAPVGRLNLADQELVIGRGLAAIRRNDRRQALLYEQLRHALGEEDSLGGGTIFKSVSKGELSSLAVLEADEPVSDRFEAAGGAMLKARVELTFQVRALATTRDLLLPRLVTGRLDIDDIDLGELLPAEAA